jgi:DNA repair protein RadC
LTAARDVMGGERAIPPKNLWSLLMSNITSIEQDLYVCDAATYRPATFEETVDAARRALAHRFRPGRSLRSPQLVEDYLRVALGSREYEVFCLICLDARYRLLGMIELFRGTVNAAQVHPREVVKESLRLNATAVILAHNHPSGIAEPSEADQLITRHLKSALAVVDIQVLDHLVVSAHEVVSFARRGLL